MTAPAAVSAAARNAAAAARRGRARSVAARRATERAVRGALFGCALLSIVSTFTILAILLYQSGLFFSMPEVTLAGFLTGTEWTPLLGAQRQFGVWPLGTGTLKPARKDVSLVDLLQAATQAQAAKEAA